MISMTLFPAGLRLSALAMMVPLGLSGGLAPERPAGFPFEAARDTTPRTVRGYTGLVIGAIRTSRLSGATVVDDSVRNPVVMRVAKDSPAERVGLMPGDVILEVNGENILTTAIRLAQLTPGARYTVRVRRNDGELEVTLVPGPERPPAPRSSG
jgi:S1-C subfamily serine protease